MKPVQLVLPERTFADWPLAARSILGFWLFYALTVVIRAFLGGDPITLLQNKTVTITAGIVLTFGIYVVLARFARVASLRRRVVSRGVVNDEDFGVGALPPRRGDDAADREPFVVCRNHDADGERPGGPGARLRLRHRQIRRRLNRCGQRYDLRWHSHPRTWPSGAEKCLGGRECETSGGKNRATRRVKNR